MTMSRRSFLRSTTAGLSGLLAAAHLAKDARAQDDAVRVGMCDWNLGKRADIGAIDVAAEIGLDGVEASVCLEDKPWLLETANQEAYVEHAEAKGIAIPSLALGVLNSVPLKSDLRAAEWLAGAIPAAGNMGAKCILMAFFGRGELKMEDEADIDHVVEILKDVAPSAADADVILGLENTLSAEDNLTIIERVGHDSLQVYYDCKNSANNGRDPAAEIRQIGNEKLCQVHFKNGRKLLSDTDNVDFAACAEALKEIGYEGWIILETSAPNGLIEDTRANMAHVQEILGP